jgi:dihydroorotate dehydrogenase electron transfer subunit
MVRLPHTTDPLLGRAFALYDAIRDDKGQGVYLEIAYAVIGRMTHRLATFKAGDTLEMWGPLGNGFPVPKSEELILVAGGIGYTPFLAVAKEAVGGARYGKTDRGQGRCRTVKLLFGVRSRDYVPTDIDRFSESGVQVVLSSDDGSVGTRGFASDLLEQELNSGTNTSRTVYCCGPEPLMAKVARLCCEKDIECLVSLETPMACGLGLCYSCVAKIRSAPDGANEWDYRRVCVEGPVFDGRRVVFDET